MSCFNDAKVDDSIEASPESRGITIGWLDGGDTEDENEPKEKRRGKFSQVVEETQVEKVEKEKADRHRKIPGTYPPTFSAAPSVSYTEWKRSVKRWIAGDRGQLPENAILDQEAWPC